MGRWTKTLASTQPYSFMSKGSRASEMRRKRCQFCASSLHSSLLAKKAGTRTGRKRKCFTPSCRCISVPKLLLPLQLMHIKREHLDSTSQRTGWHRKSEGYNCPPGEHHAFQTASGVMAFQQPIWSKSNPVPHHNWSESTQNANAAPSLQRKESPTFWSPAGVSGTWVPSLLWSGYCQSLQLCSSPITLDFHSIFFLTKAYPSYLQFTLKTCLMLQDLGLYGHPHMNDFSAFSSLHALSSNTVQGILSVEQGSLHISFQ